jgi:preprotein translocase subunit SecF
LIKDLGVAKNCLYKKQLKQSGKNNKVEIVEFVLSEDQVTINVSSDEGSDIEEMLIQKTKEKTRMVKTKDSVSPQGGGSKTRKILACMVIGILKFLLI